MRKLIDIKNYYREDGKINVCQAILDWMEDERREGFAEGEKRAEERYIHNLMKNMNITAEQAAVYLEIRSDRMADVTTKKAGRHRNRRKIHHKN